MIAVWAERSLAFTGGATSAAWLCCGAVLQKKTATAAAAMRPCKESAAPRKFIPLRRIIMGMSKSYHLISRGANARQQLALAGVCYRWGALILLLEAAFFLSDFRTFALK